MGLRAIQHRMHAQSKKQPPPQQQDEDDDDDHDPSVLAALRTAVHLFAHAVQTDRARPHPGALYSLGVLWKLYPRMMARVVGRGDSGGGGDEAASEGYRHLCLVRASS